MACYPRDEDCEQLAKNVSNWGNIRFSGECEVCFDGMNCILSVVACFRQLK